MMTDREKARLAFLEKAWGFARHHFAELAENHDWLSVPPCDGHEAQRLMEEDRRTRPDPELPPLAPDFANGVPTAAGPVPPMVPVETGPDDELHLALKLQSSPPVPGDPPQVVARIGAGYVVRAIACIISKRAATTRTITRDEIRYYLVPNPRSLEGGVRVHGFEHTTAKPMGAVGTYYALNGPVEMEE